MAHPNGGIMKCWAKLFFLRRGSITVSQLIIACSLVTLIVPWQTRSQNNNRVAVVSAASYEKAVAPDSIATAFGAQLAAQMQLAASQPLPTSLGGTVVKVNGQSCGLFFVSPSQINFLVPAQTAPG